MSISGTFRRSLDTNVAVEGEAVFDEATIGSPFDDSEYEGRLMRGHAYVTLKSSTSEPR
jgi:hypothetical protein